MPKTVSYFFSCIILTIFVTPQHSEAFECKDRMRELSSFFRRANAQLDRKLFEWEVKANHFFQKIFSKFVTQVGSRKVMGERTLVDVFVDFSKWSAQQGMRINERNINNPFFYNWLLKKGYSSGSDIIGLIENSRNGALGQSLVMFGVSPEAFVHLPIYLNWEGVVKNLMEDKHVPDLRKRHQLLFVASLIARRTMERNSSLPDDIAPGGFFTPVRNAYYLGRQKNENRFHDLYRKISAFLEKKYGDSLPEPMDFVGQRIRDARNSRVPIGN